MAAYGTYSKSTLISDITQDPNATLGDLMNALKDAGYHIDNEDASKGFVGKLNKITESLKVIDRTVMGLIEPWAKVDAAASKFAKTIGATKAGLEELRKASMKNVARGNIGFEFNMSADELIEAQQNYIKGIGRTVKLGLDDSRTLAAITSVFGDQSDMFNEFDKFGVSMQGVGTHMGKMFSEASKNGISLERYANNVKQGIAIANTYTFKDGLKGMEAMAKRASAIKMDMQQVQAFADKFSTVEDAIQNSAKLQVLGGSFASGADAIGLLNDSLNDMEALEKRLEQFTEGKGTLNKSTGEVEISAFNRLRLKEYANITGQDFNKVMEVTRRQAMRGEIEAQLNAAANPALRDKDFQELIKNTATFRDGKAGVTVNGDFKALSDLTAKDQETLIKETQSQSQDIKDIAKDVRSLADMRSGVRKQYENTQARLMSPLGQGIKGLTGWFTGTGGFGRTILGLGVGISAISNVVSGLQRLKNIWKGFGSGSVDSSASSIGRGNGAFSKMLGKKVSSAGGSIGKAASSIPKGGKAIVSTAGKSYTQVGTRVFNSAGNEIFGAAKSSVLKGATAKGSAEIGRRGAKRAATRAAIKVGGKGAAKIGTKLAAGAAKGAGVGIIGAVGNIATDMLVDSGKMKKGGGAHMAMKVGSTALEGAALGGMIGSVIPGIGNAVGAAVGAVAGAAIGAIKVQKVRNEQVVDAQLQKFGIERQGDYGAGRLSKIDKALRTGKMSNVTRRKLLRKGDAAIVEQIEAVKKEKDAEKEAKREKRRERRDKRLEARAQIAKSKFGTAHFEIGTAYFGGRGIKGRGAREKVERGVGLGKIAKRTAFGASMFTPIGPALAAIAGTRAVIRKIRGKQETGESQELSVFKRAKEKIAGRERRTEGQNAEPLNVNINGTIKLETPNGQSFDLLAEIKRNPSLTRKLTELIFKEWNTMKHGSYVDDKVGGVTA